MNNKKSTKLAMQTLLANQHVEHNLAYQCTLMNKCYNYKVMNCKSAQCKYDCSVLQTCTKYCKMITTDESKTTKYTQLF